MSIQQHAIVARPWNGRSTMVADVAEDAAAAEIKAQALREERGQRWEFWVQPVKED